MGIETLVDYIISGDGAPTTSTEGTVGKFYKDRLATDGVIFWVCTAVNVGPPVTYTWQKSAANIRME